MQDQFADPGLNVSVLAEKLKVHRATLSRVFHRETGMACIDYLVALRVRHALALLRETTLPMARVARLCGYPDPNYFCKAVKKATGYNPVRFRKL